MAAACWAVASHSAEILIYRGLVLIHAPLPFDPDRAKNQVVEKKVVKKKSEDAVRHVYVESLSLCVCLYLALQLTSLRACARPASTCPTVRLCCARLESSGCLLRVGCWATQSWCRALSCACLGHARGRVVSGPQQRACTECPWHVAAF